MKAEQLRFWHSLYFLKSQSGIIIVLILICDTYRLSSRYPNNIQGILPKAIMAKKTKKTAASRQCENDEAPSDEAPAEEMPLDEDKRPET
jgi:hypothetical protein